MVRTSRFTNWVERLLDKGDCFTLHAPSLVSRVVCFELGLYLLDESRVVSRFHHSIRTVTRSFLQGDLQSFGRWAIGRLTEAPERWQVYLRPALGCFLSTAQGERA